MRQRPKPDPVSLEEFRMHINRRAETDYRMDYMGSLAAFAISDFVLPASCSRTQEDPHR